MGAFDLQSLLSLSIAQRIELVETLWDSVAVEAQTLPLQEQERLEIELRLSEHKANPEDTVSWDRVKSELSISLRKLILGAAH
jgi:putative addiction module component (TIGR02574 family)